MALGISGLGIVFRYHTRSGKKGKKGKVKERYAITITTTSTKCHFSLVLIHLFQKSTSGD